MKKLINYLLRIVAVCALLSSCSTKLSFTKRHYKSGYYVSNTKKQSANKIKAEIKNNLSKLVHAEPLTLLNLYSQSNINDNTLTSENDINSNTNYYNTIKQPTSEYFEIHKIKNFEKPITSTVVKRNKFQYKNSIEKRDHKDDRGHSHFWVLIVILLILWALGYGIFVLGALIHLLFVVALLLFILWLLRII